MDLRETIRTAMSTAFDQVNEEREEQIEYDDVEGVTLYGDKGVFDSMALVNYLGALEECLEDEHDVTIEIMSEKALSAKRSPFRSTKALLDFLISEHQSAEESTCT